MDAPEQSAAAGDMRVLVLNRLLAADGAFDTGPLRLDPDFGGVGSPVIFTGGARIERPCWAFAHLDTISCQDAVHDRVAEEIGEPGLLIEATEARS